MKTTTMLLAAILSIGNVATIASVEARQASSHQASSPKKIEVKGKVVKKNVVMKDKRGKKIKCNIVRDTSSRTKTKRDITVC